MVICETSEQARRLYDVFQEEWQKYQPKPIKIKLSDGSYVVGEPEVDYKSKYRPLKAGIILHDTDDKETRKQIVKDFKKNMTVDILIVFNMLLTGFDAPRLKRLYFGRKLKDHNLLQAITRVNRPYPGMRYGFVIDFADIKRNFKETNEAYLQELNRFNDVDETGESAATDTFTQVIEDKEEILNQMKKVRQTLFNYTYDNAEEFSSEISTEEDKAVLLDLKQALESAKNMANIVRTFGDDEMKEQFAKLLRTENGIISSDILPIYNDLSDQLQFIIQTTESCREIISSLVDLYISNNDLRMNAIMKRLTIVSTIFIPLTFLAGIWGMNFKMMPELDWQYGYGIAWSLMLLTAISTWLYMRKKDWF